MHVSSNRPQVVHNTAITCVCISACISTSRPALRCFRDGESHNLSWNCGEEGESSSQAVLRLRGRQMRNLAAALLLAHGVPMVQMGDEYGHTKVCCISFGRELQHLPCEAEHAPCFVEKKQQYALHGSILPCSAYEYSGLCLPFQKVCRHASCLRSRCQTVL